MEHGCAWPQGPQTSMNSRQTLRLRNLLGILSRFFFASSQQSLEILKGVTPQTPPRPLLAYPMQKSALQSSPLVFIPPKEEIESRIDSRPLLRATSSSSLAGVTA